MSRVQNSKFKIQNSRDRYLRQEDAEQRAGSNEPEPRTENLILLKSFAFAVKVVKSVRLLRELREYDLASQFLRAGTSIGANVEEAVAAQSRRDFVHKLSIALKEAREAHYWAKLIVASEIASDVTYESLRSEAHQLVRIVSRIILTCKERYGLEICETGLQYAAAHVDDDEEIIKQCLSLFDTLLP